MNKFQDTSVQTEESASVAAEQEQELKNQKKSGTRRKKSAPSGGTSIKSSRKNKTRPKSTAIEASQISAAESSSQVETALPVAAETAAQKSRRGKRGGRQHKNKAQNPSEFAEKNILDSILAINAENVANKLIAIPALPPAIQKPVSEKTQDIKNTKKKTKRPSQASKKNKRMFISIIQGEQVEVGLEEDGVLLEYYLDMLHQTKLKGNIYKGVIQNIDINLQAAFIDFGGGKNGFLQISEIHPEYWQAWHEPLEPKKFPPVQKILKVGQELLVQVVKEPSGNKGAFLTTWLSLAGRFLVLTPGQEQIGVSRKVADPQERSRLREMMNGIDHGDGFGVIVRTVGEGATKTVLKNDLQYLKRQWKDIRKKATFVNAPAILYQEPRLSERAVRDYLTDDISEIWVDNEIEADNVRAMVNLLFPRKKNLVHLYSNPDFSLWEHFHLDNQLSQIYDREVLLPSGGRLVFDQTEALMAIDINSGRISGKTNFESMAFKTNMEAAEEIAKQLRLRDIGGQIVIDFIEMRDKKHILEVEKTLRQAMKNDRARHDVARMSSFGLLELVRQRMGSSALAISMEICPACGGTGLRRNLEWQSMQALRDFRRKLKTANGTNAIFDLSRELGLYLLNHKRDALKMLEEELGKKLEIRLQI